MSRYELKDITIRLVDVAEEARQIYGEKAEFIAGAPLPLKDLRLEATAERDENKIVITFHPGAKLSAEEILARVNRD